MKPQVKDNRKSPPSLSQDFQADVSNFGARTCVFWEEFSLIFPWPRGIHIIGAYINTFDMYDMYVQDMWFYDDTYS